MPPCTPRFRCTLPSPAALVLLAVSAWGLAGCGTPTQSLTLSPGTAETLQMRNWLPPALRFNVELDAIKGGEETSFWWGSKLSGLTLEQTLEDTLRTVGMLPPAPGAPPAQYQLRVEIVNLDQPLIGTPSATVTATIQYTLVDKARDAKPIYRRAVRTAHTAGMGDAFFSQPERMRLANEGAVRENILVALRDMVALPLGPAPMR